MATMEIEYEGWNLYEARHGKEQLSDQADRWRVVWRDGTTSTAASAYFAWYAYHVDPAAVDIEPVHDRC